MSTTKDKQMPRDTSFDRWEKDHVLLKGLLGDLERLLEDESSTDLHFMIDHERVSAHRLIVVARCERYRKKKRLNQPPTAGNTPLTIQLGKHFSAAAVRDVVRYLYTGKVRGLGSSMHTRHNMQTSKPKAGQRHDGVQVLTSWAGMPR